MPPLKSTPGCLAESDQDKAELLNSQFVQNFSSEDQTSVPYLKKGFPRMPDIEVTVEGVYKLLCQLKTSKAAGPDEIHPRILRETATEISPVLKCLFQKSLTLGVLPEDWRDANICPIFKKGDRSEAINYRPVSLTSIVCKLLEHVVCSRLMSHLDSHGIITDRQHAFRRLHSCVTQLCTVIHDWAQFIDHGLQTDVFILDFAKAFDTVPHERLKAKLYGYGVSGNTLRWLDAFLCHRRQRVVVSGAKSSWVPVTSGVPQAPYWAQYYLTSSLMTSLLTLNLRSVSLPMTVSATGQSEAWKTAGSSSRTLIH